MFEETRKYTEDVYCSKAMLKEHLKGMVLETLWQQVEEYRRLFRRKFNFSFYQGSIVMSVACMRKLQYTSELLYRCKHTGSLPLSIRKTLLLLQEQRDWLQKAQQLLALEALPQDAYAFLADEEEPLLLRIFFLYVCDVDVARWENILLLHANCQASTAMLIWKPDVPLATESDLTAYFLSFLDAVGLQISRSMLSLTEANISSCQTMQLQELLEHFPMLSERQLMFYVDHRTPYCCYTIRQFMEYVGVCHETARRSMEQLVERRCYMRRKIGKKYVYYTM